MNVLASPANPFGLLPDAVLLMIFRGDCDPATQQAAYKSCKDIRDFCHRNMKSVTIDLRSVESSSTTMCPQAAYGIERLCIRCGRYTISNLHQLINDAFILPKTSSSRAKQLANITSIELQLPWTDGMSVYQRETVALLLSEFVKLRSLSIDVSEPMTWVCVPQLENLACTCPVTPLTLQLFVNKHPSIQRLEIVFATQFEILQPQLLRFTALKHLNLGPAYGSSMRISAGLLAEFAQLSTLTLYKFIISDAHLLRKLHITRLTLRDVQLASKEQHLPPLENWPALKSVELLGYGSSEAPLTETLARAILPLPHAGVTVTWPHFVGYHADVPPHPQLGYMAVAHINAVNNMYLFGLHIKAALQAMVRHRANIRELHVCEGPLSLGQEDVATCLAVPSLHELRFHAMDIVLSPGVFGQLFQQCQLLDVVVVPSSCVPADMQLPPLVDAVVDGHETILCRNHVTFWDGITPEIHAARCVLHK